jgi:UDP-N-acetylmuramyl tripeptide synthase
MMIAPARPAGTASPPSVLAAGFTSVELENALASLPARSVTASSRDARRGFAFLAYPGASRDGRDFIADAITRGASAILFDPAGFAWNAEWKVPHLGVPDLKQHASQIAGSVYRHPAEELWMTGVTGTNGKTSVSQWIAQGLQLAGRKAGVIGTIGNGLVDRCCHRTTPRRMRSRCNEHCAKCCAPVPPAVRWKCPATDSTRAASRISNMTSPCSPT